MALTLKELLVVFCISAIAFALMKPVLSPFISAPDYARRRNLWLALSILGFLSPNFWVFVLLAAPLIIIAARSEPNPASLYLLTMTVIPSIPVPVPVPMIGMPNLFSMDIYLLLSFVLMTPAMLRRRRLGNSKAPEKWSIMDYCVALYGIVLAVFYVHAQTRSWGVYPSTPTESLRRAFVFGFAVFVPYKVISRSGGSRREVVEMLATFCLSCVVLAAIAMFETSRHWLLYGEFASRWGIDAGSTSYLMRGGSLRAVVTTGHSGALGTLLAIGFGFWLYLRGSVRSRLARVCVPTALALGLLADYSRGPWLGAVSIYVAFVLFGPRPLRGMFGIAGLGLVLVIVVALSPLRDRIVSVVPFLGGTIDSQNIDYRKRLFDTALPIIKASPLTGDPEALLKMGNLRQNGIIDLVNCYLEILLNSGVIGLLLFLGASFIGIKKARAVYLRYRVSDPPFATLGLALISCVIGLLIMLWPSSLSTGGYVLYFGLAGICASYALSGRSGPSGGTMDDNSRPVAGSSL
jgi:O-antigen ligase